MSFADLKHKSQNSFEFLQKELERSSTTSGGADERFWKPELDASGNGYAVIRFLPAPDGEKLPWAKLYSHAFQGPGGWLIDNCLTTNKDQCPICAANNKLWNSGIESDKEIARQRKRKLSYYSNIYVLNDSKNPDNNGKVFLYKYGKKIHDKIVDALQPKFPEDVPIDPFDLWEGANFKLKICTIGGYWNYDSSEFAAPAALNKDDGNLEAIWRQAYSLEAFTKPDQFKHYEELQARLSIVLGNKAPVSSQEFFEQDENEEPIATAVATRSNSSSKKSSDDDDDDALSYFARLAEED